MKNMRYQFFGNLIRGKISVSKLMEQGNELGIDLMAPAYNFMLFKIFSKNENDTEAVYDLRTKEDAIVEEVSSQFENMIVFHRVTEGYVLMIKAQNTEETIQVAKDYVAALTKRMKKEKELQWFAGIGHAVERLHNLSESYDSASKAFAYQYQSSGNEAVFFDKLDNEKIERAEDLQQVDFTKVNSESLEAFLKNCVQASRATGATFNVNPSARAARSSGVYFASGALVMPKIRNSAARISNRWLWRFSSHSFLKNAAKPFMRSPPERDFPASAPKFPPSPARVAFLRARRKACAALWRCRGFR